MMRARKPIFASTSADPQRDRLRILSWFAGALLIVSLGIAIGGFAYANVLDRALRHDNRLVVATERLLSSLKDVETGERGFIITGKEQYLEPYQWGTATVGPDLDIVRSFLGDETKPLSDLVDARLHEAADGIARYRQDGAAAGTASIQTDLGKAAMDRVRVEVARLQKEADDRISSTQANRTVDEVLRSLSLVGLALSCLTLAYVAIRRRRESLHSRNLLDDVLGNAPVGLGFLDPDLSIQHMNRALSQMSQNGFETRLGAPLWANQPSLKEHLLPLLEAARDKGLISTDIEVDVASESPEGLMRQFRMGFFPLQHDNGAGTSGGVGITVADITAAKLSEKRVRTGDATLRTVFDTLPVGVLIAEAPSGRITGHNARVEAILGHDVLPSQPGNGPARWVGFHEDGRRIQPAEWPLIKVVREGEPQAELEVDYQRGDGRRAWISLASAPMRDADGRLLGGVVVVSDIDARKRSEHLLAAAKLAAEEANLAKSTFLANMSHELRTPLSAIIGYSEMMLEEVEDGAEPSDLAADMRKIEGNARHLLGLINDVLDLSKVESGKMEVYTETFDVETMMREVASTVESLIDRKGNRLVLEVAESLGTMLSDVTKIRQVLLNLISNAAKFTESGTITLAASREPSSSGDQILFRVSDTGIGMTEEQRAKLFQRFVQADSSTTRKFGGTGLGLSLTKAFADMLAGTVSVESEPGQGSHFTVTLPATYADSMEADAASAPVVESAKEDASRELVLVIDDDQDQRTLMTRFLHREGFQARTAPDGRTGIAMARELKPRAILLDVMMPGIDGWSVLSALKADPELDDIPVVMVTFVEQRALAASLGASDYVLKPVRWERFKAVMDRFRPPDKHVLIVEDDTDTRARLRTLLERDGWAVQEAHDGKEGLARLADELPGLVLLDLTMPVMDGFMFLEQMRRMPECTEIPVVVLTALDLTREDRRRLAGASQILNKGEVTMRALGDRLQKLFEKPVMPERA